MEYIKLKDLCEKEERFVAPNDDAHIDYVDISSVDNKSKSLTKYDTYIFAEAPSRARKRVKHGDVIVSTVRPNLNAVARFNIQTPHTPIASTGFCVLRHKSDVDPIYIYFFCISPNFVRQMVAKATGASYPAVSDTIVREAKLPKHTAEKRIRIVSTLSKAKEIIEHRRAQLAKLDELVKCRFVEMFSHTQCPHMEIQNIAEDVFAGGDKPKDIVETRDTLHPYPVFANGEVKRGLQGYSQLCRVDKKAITVSARGTIGYCCIRDAGFTPIVRLITLIPKEHINLTYLSEAIKFIGVGASGAVQAQLTVPDFKKIKIPLPSTNEQNAFADFVHRIDKLRFVIQKSLDETQTLFNSLMQQYFD